MSNFERRQPLSKDERAAREAERKEAAAQALADHEAAEKRKRETFEWLRAERLARQHNDAN